MEVFIDSNIGSCEGPVIREAYRLTGSSEAEKLSELEKLSVASKTTKESREAAVRMGKAFMRIMKEVLRSEDFAYVKASWQRYQLPGGIWSRMQSHGN